MRKGWFLFSVVDENFRNLRGYWGPEDFHPKGVLKLSEKDVSGVQMGHYHPSFLSNFIFSPSISTLKYIYPPSCHRLVTIPSHQTDLALALASVNVFYFFGFEFDPNHNICNQYQIRSTYRTKTFWWISINPNPVTFLLGLTLIFVVSTLGFAFAYYHHRLWSSQFAYDHHLLSLLNLVSECREKIDKIDDLPATSVKVYWYNFFGRLRNIDFSLKGYVW